MAAPTVKLEPSWLEQLDAQFKMPYMRELRAFLAAEGRDAVYPPPQQYFAAFDLAPFERVRLVILGQDPYHGHRQANGLCFSVSPGQPLPPSLQNIFIELHSDLGIPVSRHGDLSHWARQGALLLNNVLTVARGRAGSHRGKGWEQLTDCAISRLNKARDGLVFMLWGQDAQRKGDIIDLDRHFVLTAAHPSPRSADTGFFGCRHFSQANAALRRMGRDPIDWQLPQ